MCGHAGISQDLLESGAARRAALAQRAERNSGATERTREAREAATDGFRVAHERPP